MKKFAFKLEQMRRWCCIEREREGAKLVAIQSELFQLEQLLRDLNRGAADTESFVERSAPVPEELHALASYRRFLARERVRLDRQMAGVRSRIEAQRQILVEAERRFEALDQLKQRTFQRWREELDREQEALVAELVVARWRGTGAG